MSESKMWMVRAEKGGRLFDQIMELNWKNYQL